MMMSVGASQAVSAAQVCFPRTRTKQLMSLLLLDHVMFCGQPKSLHLGNGTVCFCSDKNTSFPELVLHSWELVRTCIHQFKRDKQRHAQKDL
jgi:hypothetical protein